MIPFGKYLLLERLAVGGMAEVFLAKSFGIEGFEKIIAIKRILPTMAEDRDFIEMFIDEAKIAGHLNHANIVPIYELGKIGEAHYIAMEYVWGKDLLQIMNRFRKARKKMPFGMVAFIAGRMCEALGYAHGKRDRHGRPLHLVHRDISPQNILVSYEGAVKLIDFGIAKAASRTTKTQAGVLKGKFGYMSPEQVRGNPVDHRSDLFAVGTCLWEMITGERLFVGESDFSTLEKVRHADVVSPKTLRPDVPGALDAIVMRALSQEPDARFQTAEELQEALDALAVAGDAPLSTATLADWMREAFGEEQRSEKRRLEGFSEVGRAAPAPRRRVTSPALTPPVSALVPAAGAAKPTLPVGAGPAAAPPKHLELAPAADDWDDEATMVTASPFEAMEGDAPATPGPLLVDAAGASAEGDLDGEPTQIFFTSEEVDAPAKGVQVFSPPSTAPVGAPRLGRAGEDAPTRELAPGSPASLIDAARPIDAAVPNNAAVPNDAAVPASSAGSAPASARPASSTPRSAPPSAVPGAGPSHARPSGAAPSGAAPSSAAPSGAAPSGAAPSSAAPSGAAPSGAAPSGAASSRAPARPMAGAAAGGFVLPRDPRPTVGEEQMRAEFLAPTDPTVTGLALPAPRRSGAATAVWAALALVALGLGAGAAYLAFGPEPMGRITVSVRPDVGAELRLDGVASGTLHGPLTLPAVPPGRHVLEVVAPGYETQRKEVQVQPNGSAEFELLLLRAADAPRAPPVDAPPAGGTEGTVAGGGEDDLAAPPALAPAPLPVGMAPPAGAPPAPPATDPSPMSATRMASNEGMGSATRASSSSRAERGNLVVNSMPLAEVFVDGRRRGRTPMPRLTLPAGRHTVELRTSDGRRHSETVDLEAGTTARVIHRF